MSLFRRSPRDTSPGGAELAPTLFGTLAGTRDPAALRLVADGVVVRRRGHADRLVALADIADVTVQDDGIVVACADSESIALVGEDRGRYPAWVTAYGDLVAAATAEEPAPMIATSADARAGAVRVPLLLGRARPPALLVLEDGTVCRGESFGADGESFGEAVFNTGMTGYQETLTDPSYHRQVVVMTAPQIGNTGANDVDPESDRIWVAGFVVRDPSPVASSWRARRSLDDGLRAAGVVAIGGVDTRALTRRLRSAGSMRCAVSTVETDPEALLGRVLASPGMAGADLAREVTTSEPYVVPAVGERRLRVAALDLGMKRSTPAYLAAHGVEVHVLPATATADDLLATDPDGVFFSNGPGDPAVTTYAVEAMRGVLGVRPVFGICLGNQILGRALGLGTFKLKFGHRGVNQPVQDLVTGRVAITSHNHGFAVSAPGDVRDPIATAYGAVAVSHVDLNDGVVEGLRCVDVPAFSVQYHPEAAPGPHDATGLFADFVRMMSLAGTRR